MVSLDFYPRYLVYGTLISWIKSIYLLLCFPFLPQMTPLHLAAESGRIKILDYLVEQGVDINIQDDYGVIICEHTYQWC